MTRPNEPESELPARQPMRRVEAVKKGYGELPEFFRLRRGARLRPKAYLLPAFWSEHEVRRHCEATLEHHLPYVKFMARIDGPVDTKLMWSNRLHHAILNSVLREMTVSHLTAVPPAPPVPPVAEPEFGMTRAEQGKAKRIRKAAARVAARDARAYAETVRRAQQRARKIANRESEYLEIKATLDEHPDGSEKAARIHTRLDAIDQRRRSMIYQVFLENLKRKDAAKEAAETHEELRKIAHDEVKQALARYYEAHPPRPLQPRKKR